MISQFKFFSKKWIILFILFFFCTKKITSAQIPKEEAIIQKGKILFEENCTVCHAIHEEIVGPALKNVHQRQTLDWLKKFIRNSQQVIQSGDAYAVQLYEQYNKTQMTSFDFSNEEIMSLLAYIQESSKEKIPLSSIESTPTMESTKEKISTNVDDHLFIKKYFPYIIISLLGILLLILISLLVMITMLINRYQKKDNILPKKKRQPFKKAKKLLLHPTTHYTTLLILVGLIIKTTVEGLYAVGVQQHYAPQQPIAFSHQLHAGKLNIDCQYCHTGVLKSKNASIPSANICMNCHHQIKKDSPEIKKIHLAVEKNQPIEWIRVHNLPKLAYFNHAQHVKVGNIACEQCHGPVQEMEVIYQHQPLTMGWCIDCHRKTDVEAKGNAYYDQLIKIHQKEHPNKPLKVADIGGLACGKCHY